MSIESEQDLEGLLEAGRVVRAALNDMKRHIRPGVETREINRVGAETIRWLGGRSAPMIVYGFPAEVCISVNEEIVHGIPSGRRLRSGDLVKMDVTVEKNGYMADAAITVPVGVVSTKKRELVECVERSFERGMSAARAGNRVYDIGRAVEKEVKRSGFSVVRELVGHSIGRTIHEEPYIPNYCDYRYDQRLTEGLVITIEPMVSMGAGRTRQSKDGWAVSTADGSFAAHYEQTIVVTRAQPLILTAA